MGKEHETTGEVQAFFVSLSLGSSLRARVEAGESAALSAKFGGMQTDDGHGNSSLYGERRRGRRSGGRWRAREIIFGSPGFWKPRTVTVCERLSQPLAAMACPSP